jgi:hypothetical protein
MLSMRRRWSAWGEKQRQPAIAQAQAVPQYVDVPPMNHPTTQPRRQTQAELDAQLALHTDLMAQLHRPKR